MKSLRGWRLALVVGLTFLVLLAIAASVPWKLNFARGWIAQKVEASTGRALQIEGDIVWRFGMPGHLTVDGLRFANPAWAGRPVMLAAQRIDADVALLPLLTGRLVIPRLKAIEPDLWLEVSPSNQRNWQLDRKPSDPASKPPEVGNVELTRGALSFAQPAKNTEVRVELGTVAVDARRLADAASASASSPASSPASTAASVSASAPAAAGSAATPVASATASSGTRLALTATGRINGMPLKASAHGDGVLQMQAALNDKRPYAFDLEASIGGTRIAVEGSIAEPALPGNADLKVRASGPTLGDWYRITGIGIPDSPPYRTEGRLLHEGGRWSYQDFTGVIGRSDFGGHIAFEPGAKRPRVSGELVSTSLDLADFAPLLGKTGAASSPTASKKRDAKSAGKGSARTPARPTAGTAKEDGDTAPGRVLPQGKLSAEKWDTLDADLRFTGKQVRNIGSFPIDALAFRVRMEDRQLTLEPFNATLGGGQLEGSLQVDGRSQPMAAKLDMQVRRLALENLLPQIQDSRAALGRINGRVRLAGQGASYAAMLGTADGEAQFAMGQGRMSNLLLELLGLDAYEALGFLVRGDKVVEVRCALADVGFKQGVMQTRTAVLDTSDTIIDITGTTDFAQERLGLRITPQSKDMSLLTLRVPIDVKGAFAAPDVFPDRGRLAMRGGAAVLLGLINPFAALIPLIETGPGKDADCAGLTAVARKEGVPVKSETGAAPDAAQNKK